MDCVRARECWPVSARMSLKRHYPFPYYFHSSFRAVFCCCSDQCFSPLAGAGVWVHSIQDLVTGDWCRLLWPGDFDLEKHFLLRRQRMCHDYHLIRHWYGDKEPLDLSPFIAISHSAILIRKQGDCRWITRHYTHLSMISRLLPRVSSIYYVQ